MFLPGAADFSYEPVSYTHLYSNIMEKPPHELLAAMMRSFEEDISDLVFIARLLSLGTSTSHLDQMVSPRGYRMLQKLPRIPTSIIDNLVERFGLLTHILRASIEELDLSLIHI